MIAEFWNGRMSKYLNDSQIEMTYDKVNLTWIMIAYANLYDVSCSSLHF